MIERATTHNILKNGNEATLCFFMIKLRAYHTLLSHGGVAVSVDNHTPGYTVACVLEWRRYGE